jgi:hypothetical protein
LLVTVKNGDGYRSGAVRTHVHRASIMQRHYPLEDTNSLKEERAYSPGLGRPSVSLIWRSVSMNRDILYFALSIIWCAIVSSFLLFAIFAH